MNATKQIRRNADGRRNLTIIEAIRRGFSVRIEPCEVAGKDGYTVSAFEDGKEWAVFAECSDRGESQLDLIFQKLPSIWRYELGE